MRNVLLLLSGGIDSMVTLDILQRNSQKVGALFVDYGQSAASIELEASTRIADHFGIKLRAHKFLDSSVFGEGEIANRNGFLIFLAAFLAGFSVEAIAVGIHAGVPYSDCSGAFLDSLNGSLQTSSAGKMRLLAPLRSWHKQEIIAYALDQKLPLHLTYSCERGSRIPCGVCLSCRDRRGLEC